MSEGKKQDSDVSKTLDWIEKAVLTSVKPDPAGNGYCSRIRDNISSAFLPGKNCGSYIPEPESPH